MHTKPILSFELFGSKLSVSLYGVFISIGILACLCVFYLFTRKMNMKEKVQDFIFFVTVASIALGFLFAKLYQAVYNWLDTGVFNFYKAGITAMGGFIGGAGVFLLLYFGLGRFIFKGKEENLHYKEFPKILQCAPCCIAIAHAFGRIGCLMAGCCHGTYLGKNPVAGGVYMDGVKNGLGYYIPAQLYEAIFLFLLFGVLTLLYFKRSNLTMPVYLISYGIWRIIIEFFRGDDRGFTLLGLSPSQWQSFVFILAGIGLILFYYFAKKPWKFEKDNK